MANNFFKRTYGHTLILLTFLLCFPVITAFNLLAETHQAIYTDDFEGYVNTYQLQKAYSHWEDGANLEVTLDRTHGDGAGNALQIRVVGPNSVDGQKSGSIFHSLPLFNRNWTGAAGVAFWLSNPSDNVLWLTFNFKEAHNEYWSVTPGSPLFLSDEDGLYIQSECQYGNLVIPAQFTGRVVIPFTSFSVPEWNTARGDFELQTRSIESFAVGITLNNDNPRTFYFDTFEVLGGEDVPAFIQGETVIRVPDSGEHRETYNIQNISTLQDKVGSWDVISQSYRTVTIDQDGVLNIPAGSVNETIFVEYDIGQDTDNTVVRLPIFLVSEKGLEDESTRNNPGNDVPSALLEKSDYDRFSEDFETWALENRPLFVTISVFLVVLVIYTLSVFQNKLK